MIKAWARARDVAQDEHWQYTMLKLGVEAHTTSYSIVIKACAETRAVAHAEHPLNTMLKAGLGAKATAL